MINLLGLFIMKNDSHYQDERGNKKKRYKPSDIGGGIHFSVV
jgi:hypothetical protein